MWTIEFTRVGIGVQYRVKYANDASQTLVVSTEMTIPIFIRVHLSYRSIIELGAPSPNE